jgi:hypothetical protein
VRAADFALDPSSGRIWLVGERGSAQVALELDTDRASRAKAALGEALQAVDSWVGESDDS